MLWRFFSVASENRIAVSARFQRKMIIDCHCHAGWGDGLSGPWDTRAPLRDYRRRADAAGIAHTVLFSVFDSDYRDANRRVGEIVTRDPHRFSGFAFVHAERDRGRIRELVVEAKERFGFRGIKVHHHDARISREVCEVAGEAGLPVLCDVMGDVSVAELVAAEYPDVPFIFPHFGSFSDDWAAQRGFIDLAARRRNVFVDTSGVRRFDLLREAASRAGAETLLFGSDGPWLHPGLELHKIRLLGLSRAEERLVLGGNLEAIWAGAWRQRGPGSSCGDRSVACS